MEPVLTGFQSNPCVETSNVIFDLGYTEGPKITMHELTLEL